MALFLIRYGEIALKSPPVRSRMESILERNIRAALKKAGIPCEIKRSPGRLFLQAESPKTARALQRVFGIVSFSPSLPCQAGMEEIKKLALETAKKCRFQTFAIKARRTGGHFSSQEINIQVGEEIRTKLNKKVDLSSPDLTLFIEVRGPQAFLFTEKIPGPGGLPVGSQGRALSLIPNSQGILSTLLGMKRGCLPILVFTKKSLLPSKEALEQWSPLPLRHHLLEHPTLPSLKELAQKEGAVALFSPATRLEDLEKLKEPGLLLLAPLTGMGPREIRAGLSRLKAGTLF